MRHIFPTFLSSRCTLNTPFWQNLNTTIHTVQFLFIYIYITLQTLLDFDQKITTYDYTQYYIKVLRKPLVTN